MQETQEMWVRFLGWEDPLEEGISTPVVLPGKCRVQRSLASCSQWGRRVGHNLAPEQVHTHRHDQWVVNRELISVLLTILHM